MTPADVLSQDRFDLIMQLVTRKTFTRPAHIAQIETPITKAEAEAFAMKWVGVTAAWWPDPVQLCWFRLTRSTTPEQRLSFERLITALCTMRGMERHEEGARICAENREAEARRDLEEAERWALNRWRDPWPSPTDQSS